MPESLYRPPADLTTSAPVNPNTVNVQEGVATTVSPTGTPVIPPAAVPYALAGIGLLQVVEEEVRDPSPWSAARVLSLAIRIGTYLTLGALPGLRRGGYRSPPVQ